MLSFFISIGLKLSSDVFEISVHGIESSQFKQNVRDVCYKKTWRVLRVWIVGREMDLYGKTLVVNMFLVILYLFLA